MSQPDRPIPAVFDRVSTRVFVKKSVSDEALHAILLAGSMAPSSGNMQPWEFIVIKDDLTKEDVVGCTFSGYYSKGSSHQYWMKDAGVLIVACANLKRTMARYGPAGRDWALLDTAAAVQNMLLTATASGLSGCWVGGFLERDMKKILGIPEYVKIIGVIAIGYPAVKPSPKYRMPLEWVTHDSRYNMPYVFENTSPNL